MTFVEPDSPGGEPTITPPEILPGPDVESVGAPAELPQQDPDGVGEGRARPDDIE